MRLPTVQTPLGIISLFVALVELFLAYPVTQLEGTERLILIIFMTAFPFFVATVFFFILWHRPLHLYSPKDVPQELHSRYQAKTVALELQVTELEAQIQQLYQQDTMFEALVLPPADDIAQIAGESEQIAQPPDESIKALEEEVQARFKSTSVDDEKVVEQAKREIQNAREESKKRKVQRTLEEMSKFRGWLAGRGFS